MQADKAFQDGVGPCDASRARSRELLSLARGSLASAAARSLRTRSQVAMGTEFTLYLDSADEVRAQACFDAVFDEIERLEATFSRFRVSSEISRLNREACNGPMVTDPEVYQLLAAALDLSRKTEGAFDITVGRLTRAWGFSVRQPRIPDAQTMAAAQECVGWTNIELDPEWRTVETPAPAYHQAMAGWRVRRPVARLPGRRPPGRGALGVRPRWVANGTRGSNIFLGLRYVSPMAVDVQGLHQGLDPIRRRPACRCCPAPPAGSPRAPSPPR